METGAAKKSEKERKLISQLAGSYGCSPKEKDKLNEFSPICPPANTPLHNKTYVSPISSIFTPNKSVEVAIDYFDSSNMSNVWAFWEHSFGHLVVCMCCPVCVLA